MTAANSRSTTGAGHEQAGLFEDMYRKLRPGVYRYALLLSRDRDAAEDLVQEAFLRAHANLGQLREVGHARGWLMSITRNAWREGRRRAHPNALPLGAEYGHYSTSLSQSPEAQAALREFAEGLWRAIGNLPGKYREPLLLRAIEEMPVRDIAATLSISCETAKTRIHRARNLLSNRLFVKRSCPQAVTSDIVGQVSDRECRLFFVEL